MPTVKLSFRNPQDAQAKEWLQRCESEINERLAKLELGLDAFGSVCLYTDDGSDFYQVHWKGGLKEKENPGQKPGEKPTEGEIVDEETSYDTGEYITEGGGLIPLLFSLLSAVPTCFQSSGRIPDNPRFTVALEGDSDSQVIHLLDNITGERARISKTGIKVAK